MICTAPQLRAAAAECQARFLVMLPLIETHARLVFRRLDPEARDDAVQEVIANAFVAFARLVELQKVDVAYPSALARFAVAQFRDGRRVGNRMNVRDVLSPYAQKRRRIAKFKTRHADGLGRRFAYAGTAGDRNRHVMSGRVS